MNPKDRNDTSFLNFSSWTFGRRFCSNQRPCPWWVWELSIILFSALFSSKLLLIWGGKNYIDIHNLYNHGMILPVLFTAFQLLTLKIPPPDASTNFSIQLIQWKNVKTYASYVEMLKGRRMQIFPTWMDIPWQFPSGVDLMDIDMTIPDLKPTSWLGKIGVATSPGDSVRDPRTAICEL